jgi:hypothetical protein
MSENFTRPTTDATRKIVAETTKGEAYGEYENMKAALRNSLGMPNPVTETMELPPTPSAQQAAPLSEQSSAPQNCVRVVYPHLNDRFEIFAASEEELDRKEAALRALYQ